MKYSILQKLSEITQEEQIFFSNGDTLNKTVYSRSSRFYIEKTHACNSNICYGAKDSPLNMKTHIRMTDFPPHSHDYVEIMYVCQGEITNIIGSEEIILRKGDIIILGKDTIHSTKKASIQDVGVVFLVSCDFFTAICNKLRSSAIINDKLFIQLTASAVSTYSLFHTDEILEVDNLMENIIASFIYQTEKSFYILRLEFQLLMSYLISLPEVKSEFFTDNSKTDNSLRIFNHYIETSYATANLSSIAEKLNFTPTYLCRWVRRHYGTSFKELLCSKRFDISLELLCSSSLSINDIIRSVGYDNTSYFYKEFRKRFGCTPKEFRKHISK